MEVDKPQQTRPWIDFLDQERSDVKPKTPSDRIYTPMSKQRRKSSGHRMSGFIQTMEGALEKMKSRNLNFRSEQAANGSRTGQAKSIASLKTSPHAKSEQNNFKSLLLHKLANLR